MDKLKVGILGATGAAGLEFVRALDNHPWFQVCELYASSRSSGNTLRNACMLNTSEISDSIADIKISSLSDINYSLDLLCSALPSDVAREVEANCAKKTPVISTTSAYRYEDDVPVVITEVNASHYNLLSSQSNRGWSGWIAPGPNCTTVGLVMSLKPLIDSFGIKEVIMSSYQAVSGGGASLIAKWCKQKNVGPGALNVNEPFIEGNVIGYIKDEEDKVRRESKKILGSYTSSMILPAVFDIDCTCVRVPVLNGHFESVFVKTNKHCSVEDVKLAFKSFNDYCANEFGSLPSSPKETLVLLDRAPQPLFDASINGGMSAVVGRIECGFIDNLIKYEVISNNTQKGAAKGSVQFTEYLYKKGFF